MRSFHPISIDEIFSASELPLLDVRSPVEYAHGHIPGAINFPLLDNEERAKVGTCYKEKGNYEAVLLGYELVGPKFPDYIKKALEISPEKKLNLHCFRGGLRSTIMANLLVSAGFEVNLLKGGYKVYRKYVHETLESPKNLVVLGGMTGSGKTALLLKLAQAGEQIIDLEQLARHRGSSFGAIGNEPQPTYEQFENDLALEWSILDPQRVTWIEDESRMTGRINIPDPVYYSMRSALHAELQIPFEKRVERIVDEYLQHPLEELAAGTARLKKRLGDLRTRQALDHLHKGRHKEWVEMLLEYYDKTYLHGISKREEHKRVQLPFEEKDVDAISFLRKFRRKTLVANSPVDH